jgi:uncharacterized protein with HEPN domain
MLDAAHAALGFVAGKQRGDLAQDEMLRRALLHAVLEIGEAAARTSESSRAHIPGLPWGAIVETRNILVHVYWAVDLDKVWATVAQDLPMLIAAVEPVLQRWPMASDRPLPPPS